jgi:hypothetical protein
VGLAVIDRCLRLLDCEELSEHAKPLLRDVLHLTVLNSVKRLHTFVLFTKALFFGLDGHLHHRWSSDWLWLRLLWLWLRLRLGLDRNSLSFPYNCSCAFLNLRLLFAQID